MSDDAFDIVFLLGCTVRGRSSAWSTRLLTCKAVVTLIVRKIALVVEFRRLGTLTPSQRRLRLVLSHGIDRMRIPIGVSVSEHVLLDRVSGVVTIPAGEHLICVARTVGGHVTE